MNSEKDYEELQSTLAEVRGTALELANSLGGLKNAEKISAAAQFFDSKVVSASMESHGFTDEQVFEQQRTIKRAVQRGIRQLAESLRSDGMPTDRVAAIGELYSAALVLSSLS